MKRSIFLPLALSVALVGVTVPPSTAQETNVITLAALAAEALQRNPELKFYEAGLNAAHAGRRTAGLLSNPEISGDVGQKNIRGDGLEREGLAWSVSVMQPFEWPGRLGLRKAIANRDVELAELGLARFKTALAARVRQLGCDLFAAQEKATAAREVAERFHQLREVLVQRDPAGLTPLLETRVIEATELTAQRVASEAQLAADAALIELNQLRGLPANDPCTVAHPRFQLPEIPGLTELLTMARTNHFELKVRAVELAQQGLRVDLAKNERMPSIAVGPTYSEERAGDRERVIGLGVSFPLPLWNRNTANVEAARARQEQAEVALALSIRDVERQVAVALRTYEAKRNEIENWKPDAVQHFQEAASLADRHYRLGAVPLSTYVELQKQYLEAVQALVDTRREALQAAQSLELLCGLPLVAGFSNPTP